MQLAALGVYRSNCAVITWQLQPAQRLPRAGENAETLAGLWERASIACLAALPAGPSSGRRPGTAAGARLSGQLRPRTSAQRSNLSCRAAATDGAVTVRFTVTRKVKFGESLKVVGSEPVLGSWQVDDAPGMSWREDNVWEAEVTLPPGAAAEFKCVRVGGRGEEWEQGDNHRLSVPAAAGGSELAVVVSWGGEVQISSTASSSSSSSSETAPSTGSGGVAGGAAGAAESEAAEDGGSSSDAGGAASSDDDLPRQQWQGREVVFMQSNAHSRCACPRRVLFGKESMTFVACLPQPLESGIGFGGPAERVSRWPLSAVGCCPFASLSACVATSASVAVNHMPCRHHLALPTPPHPSP